MEAVVKVLFHTPDCPLLFHLPFSLPCLETSYRFTPAGSGKDSFSFTHAGLQVHPLQLDRHVPQFVNDAPLHLEERINLLYRPQKGRVAVGGDELEVFALEPPALEVNQEGTPAFDIFTICHLERKRLPAAVPFHPQGAEHHLSPDSYFPDLLGNPTEEKEGGNHR